MNKIRQFFIAAFLFAAAGNVHAIGAGFQFSGIPSVNFRLREPTVDTVFSGGGSVSGTMLFDRIPLAAGLGFGASEYDGTALIGMNVFADCLFAGGQIANTWSWTAGSGMCGEFAFDLGGNPYLGFGFRVVGGVSRTFFDGFLEFYMELCAVPYFLYRPGQNSQSDFCLKFPLESGLRFHF